MSDILSSGKTPEEWADIMSARGLPVSARTIRQKANRLGACHKLGRAMIITPEQLDQILSERAKEFRSNRTSGAQRGGHLPSSKATAAARAHLLDLAQGSSGAKKKKGAA